MDTNTLMNVTLPDFLSRRLLIIAGKGGVGRTTVACALAMMAARAGKRVLLAQTKSSEPMEPLLGVTTPLSKIQQIGPLLWAVSMTPELALEEYGTMMLRSTFLYRQLFDRDIVRSLLRAIPGLFDYAMLGKVWYHTTEKIQNQHRFDLVILDSPATGHLLSMLKIPKSILSVVPNGPLKTPAYECQSLLTDETRCQALVVTLAEELPVYESIELQKKLHGLSISTGALIINRLYPQRFSEEMPWSISTNPVFQTTHFLQSLLDAGLFQKSRADLDKKYIKKLHLEIPVPQIHLPYLFRPTFGKEATYELSKHLERQIVSSTKIYK